MISSLKQLEPDVLLGGLFEETQIDLARALCNISEGVQPVLAHLEEQLCVPLAGRDLELRKFR